jgi:hypothetical protein
MMASSSKRQKQNHIGVPLYMRLPPLGRRAWYHMHACGESPPSDHPLTPRGMAPMLIDFTCYAAIEYGSPYCASPCFSFLKSSRLLLLCFLDSSPPGFSSSAPPTAPPPLAPPTTRPPPTAVAVPLPPHRTTSLLVSHRPLKSLRTAPPIAPNPNFDLGHRCHCLR